jgi:hypothetical protein
VPNNFSNVLFISPTSAFQDFLLAVFSIVLRTRRRPLDECKIGQGDIIERFFGRTINHSPQANYYFFFLILLLQFVFWTTDSNARFLLGDSAVFLSTSWKTNPSSVFSWVYGTFVEIIGNFFPNLNYVLYANVAALIAAQFLLVRLLLGNGSGIRGVIIFLACTSISPVLLYYTRAVLTDVLTACLLAVLVYVLARMPRHWSPWTVAYIVSAACLAFLVVSLRNAYLPLILGLGPAFAVGMILSGEARAQKLHRVAVLSGALVFGALLVMLANSKVLSTGLSFNKESPSYLLALITPAISCDVVVKFDPGFDCENLRRWKTQDLGQRVENLFRPGRFTAYTNDLAQRLGQPPLEFKKRMLVETIRANPSEVVQVLAANVWKYVIPSSYRTPNHVLDFENGKSYPAFSKEHETFAHNFSGTPLEHINTGDFPVGFLDGLRSKGWQFAWTDKTPNEPSIARSLLVHYQWIDWCLLMMGLILSMGTIYRWKQVNDMQRWAALVILIYVPSLSLFSFDVIVRYLAPISIMAPFLAASWLSKTTRQECSNT